MSSDVSNENQSRLDWLDIAKCIGIFFIVLGHICKYDYRENPLRLFCYSFNAQFFFFVAGITFCGLRPITINLLNKKKPIRFCMNQIKRLILPYFVWGGISVVIYYFLGKLHLVNDDTSILPNMIGLIVADSTSEYFQWNRPLWFIPCLFILNCFWFFSCKVLTFFSKGKIQINFIVIGISVITFFLSILFTDFPEILSLPWHIQSAIFICSLMGLGILSKEWFKTISHKKNSIKLLIIIFMIIISVSCGSLTIFTDFRQSVFNGYIRFYIVSLCLSIAVIITGQIIKHNNIMQYIGKHTLPILLIHKFPVLFFQKICPVLNALINRGNIYAEITCCVLTIAMCLGVSYFFEKYLPGIIGGKIK